MRRSRAAFASAAFFVAAPGTVAGLVPWLITEGEFLAPTRYWVLARVLGAALICVGLVPPVHAFIEFVKADGTPMPVAPTKRLVVSGFNRYVRNPMYAGLLVVIIGEALLFGQFGLLLYAAGVWAVTAWFVRWYEEPTLLRTFGAEYEAYRQAVPAWRPRLHAWQQLSEPGSGA